MLPILYSPGPRFETVATKARCSFLDLQKGAEEAINAAALLGRKIDEIFPFDLATAERRFPSQRDKI
jgi:hypothetical protein